MNKPNTKEIELQQQISADERTLAGALERARKFESNTKAELANLESELPNILLSCIHGRGDEEQKLEIRNRISELKADLADLPFLDQGFEKERAKITAKQNRERIFRAKRQSYEELKSRLADEPRLFGIGTIDDLRSFAKSLDCLDDCESFIEEMQGVAA